MTALPAGRLPARFPLRPLVLACALAAAPAAPAATWLVNDQAGLQAAILAVNASSGANFIELGGDITLASPLSAITGTVTIKGNGHTLSGDGQFSLFDIGLDSGRRILVQLSDLVLANGLAAGADGVNGEGGGLGAGAALVVNSRADVVLEDVVLDTNSATGGDGAAAGATPGTAGGYGEGGAAGGGAGGVGGGDGGAAGGGGGAALGGAIFVADGAGLSIGGATRLSGNSVQAGAGAVDGGDGSAAGAGLFLQGSGNLVLRVAGADTMRLLDGIADAAGAALPGASADDRWNLFVAGGGGVPVDTDRPELGKVYGRVELGGSNLFGGDLYVSGADIAIANTGALGSPSSVLAVDDGGIVLADGVDLDHDVVINTGGGRLGVATGTATFSGSLGGNGAMAKVGAGDLVLQGGATGASRWLVHDGALVLDSDARLGSATLVLSSGGIRYSSAFDDLRAFTVLDSGYLDTGVFDVRITNTISGIGPVTFLGTGHVQVDSQMTNIGGTFVAAGTVSGRIGAGDLTVMSGATYELGGQDRLVGGIAGDGDIVLGNHDLTTRQLGTPDAPLEYRFTGTISGDGALNVTGNSDASLFLVGPNSYTGGTRISNTTLVIGSDASVGSGGIVLDGGTLGFTQASSNLDLVIDGSGTLNSSGDLTMTGLIADAGAPVVLQKTGNGMLVLDHANTYSGTTIVSGADSLLALRNAQGLGNSNLELSDGGGLRLLTDTSSLLEVTLAGGDGVIDTNGFVATVNNGFSGSGSLVKQGGGTLVLASDSTFLGGTRVEAGTLQVGDGGSAGTLGGGDVAIAAAGMLRFARDGVVTLDGTLSGAGTLQVDGPGRVALRTTTDVFNGAMQVLGGTLAFHDDGQLGRDPVLLDGGGLELDPALGVTDGISEVALTIGASGGGLVAAAGNTWTQAGDLDGGGALHKTGAGRVILSGVAAHGGGTVVEDGVLQVGAGLAGVLVGDAVVNAAGTLGFGRDDLTIYTGVISGDGDLEKSAAGELVLTGENTYAGTTRILQGNVRVGYGGTAGSIDSDVALAAGTALVFDRSDIFNHGGDIGGDGMLVKNGAGTLVYTGEATHAGGTLANGGVLQLGDGGTGGNIAGDVTLLGLSRLAINRSDDLVLAADLAGNGLLMQAGTGTTTYTGTNTLSGGTWVRGGILAIDSDARLGSGAVLLDGGRLGYAAAFDDLRDVGIGSHGGGLDTGGFDVRYDGLASGSGWFVKSGAGELTVGGVLATAGVRVMQDRLRIGDGGTTGTLIGNVQIDGAGELAFAHADDLLFAGVLEGDGRIVQEGSGLLQLTGNSALFAGETRVAGGTLRLDGRLGGNLATLAGTTLTGNGRLGGNLGIGNGSLLATGASVAGGSSIGTLTVDGDVAFDAGSTWQVEVAADGSGDRIAIGGSATVDGSIAVLAGGGEYSTALTYRILDASAVSGAFDAVTSDLVFLTPTLVYGADHVDLRLVRNGNAFTTVTLTRNQQAVAGALDRLDPAHPAVVHVQNQDIEGARDAYDAMNGDSLLAGLGLADRAGELFVDRLRSRASRLGLASRGPVDERLASAWQAMEAGAPPEAPALPAAEGADDTAGRSPVARVEGLWVEVKQLSSQEQVDSLTGNAAVSGDGQMLLLGVDGYWRDDLILGAGIGTVQQSFDFDNRISSGNVDQFLFGVYGRWDAGPRFQLKAALGFVQGDIDQRRHDVVSDSWLSSAASTSGWSAVVEGGVPMHVSGWGVRPFALLALGVTSRDGFTETPAIPAALDVAAGDASGGEVGLGVEASRPWLLGGNRWAQFEASAELRQPWGDAQLSQSTALTGTGEWYTVEAAPADGAVLGVGLGAECYLARNTALWGGYRGRFGGAVDENSLVLSLLVRW